MCVDLSDHFKPIQVPEHHDSVDGSGEQSTKCIGHGQNGYGTSVTEEVGFEMEMHGILVTRKIPHCHCTILAGCHDSLRIRT